MDIFKTSYLETALWSSNDDNKEPFDKNYSIENFSEETLKKATEDCDSFKKQAGLLLFDDLDDKQVGHDFWLTRNRHGAGFWDGDYEKEVGNKLTEITRKFKEINIVLGDDGKLHFE